MCAVLRPKTLKPARPASTSCHAAGTDSTTSTVQAEKLDGMLAKRGDKVDHVLNSKVPDELLVRRQFPAARLEKILWKHAMCCSDVALGCCTCTCCQDSAAPPSAQRGRWRAFDHWSMMDSVPEHTRSSFHSWTPHRVVLYMDRWSA